MKKHIKLHSNIINSLMLLFCLAFGACEDVIDVDLATGEAKVVIDAEILWQKGTSGAMQTIRISRMAGYYSPTPPKVSWAIVRVEDANGNTFIFNESEEPGVYVCTNFEPVLHMTYTLYVQVGEEIYSATETMMPVPEINRVEQQFAGGFSGDNIEVSIHYDDPADMANFYLTDFTTAILPYPEYELTDDEFNNGNEIKNEFDHEDLRQGDVVEITLRGVSRQFHDYMNLILDASSSNPFSTPPANIRGNIISQTVGSSPALGYFRLCESDHRVYTVQ